MYLFKYLFMHYKKGTCSDSISDPTNMKCLDSTIQNPSCLKCDGGIANC